MTRAERGFFVFGLMVGLASAGFIHLVLRSIGTSDTPQEAIVTAPNTALSKAKILLRYEPDPPTAKSPTNFRVTVLDSTGKTQPDYQVWLTLVMPAMPSLQMGEMRLSTDLSWNGSEYSGTTALPMEGPWDLTVNVGRNSQSFAAYRTHFEARQR